MTAPEYKVLENGNSVANITIGNNIPFKRQGSEEWEKKTGFFPVTLWNKQAEAVKDLEKGALIRIEGHLAQNTWTAKDGAYHNQLYILGNKIEEFAYERKNTAEIER